MKDCAAKGRMTNQTDAWKERNRKLNGQHVEQVKALLAEDLNLNQIGKRMQVTGKAVGEFCRRYGLEQNFGVGGKRLMTVFP